MLVPALLIQAKPQTGEIITVKVENEAKAAKSKITVRFTELVEDSRCPKGTNCVWAGEGKIKIQVSKAGEKSEIFEVSTSDQRDTATFAGYRLRLIGLKPQPAMNVRINRRSYTATIEITKA